MRNANHAAGLEPELVQRIEKVAAFISRKPQFENTLRTKERTNPRFAFLFGGRGHALFRSKLGDAVADSTSQFSSGAVISRMIRKVSQVHMKAAAVLCWMSRG